MSDYLRVVLWGDRLVETKVATKAERWAGWMALRWAAAWVGLMALRMASC